MIRFARALTAAALRATAEGVERAALAIEPMGYDPGDGRIIPPPKVGRWQIVALSVYSNRPDRVVGRYRLRWVARLIAGRLPAVSDGRDRYIVERVNPTVGVTAPSLSPGGEPDA